MLVILLNCVTLGMFQPCEDVNCQSEWCRILQVSVIPSQMGLHEHSVLKAFFLSVIFFFQREQHATFYKNVLMAYLLEVSSCCDSIMWDSLWKDRAPPLPPWATVAVWRNALLQLKKHCGEPPAAQQRERERLWGTHSPGWLTALRLSSWPRFAISDGAVYVQIIEDP